jgi:hypothetical protein
VGPRDGHFARSGALLWRRLPDRLLVLQPAPSSELLTLAGTALDVWDELDRPRPLAELADAVARRYGMTADLVEADVAGLLDELERHGAVARVPQP